MLVSKTGHCYSIHIDELVQTEQALAEIGQRLTADLVRRQGRLPSCAAGDLMVQKLQRREQLGIAWRPGGGQSKAQRHPVSAIRSTLREQWPGEIVRAIAKKRIVEKCQGLWGDGGIVSLAATGGSIRTVEHLHERMLHDALVKHVYAAAARFRRVAGVGRIGTFGIAGDHGFGRNWGLEGSAELRGIQRAADREQRVAKDFGL